MSKKLRGTLNGLIMVAGSLGHGVGPIAGSVLYAVLTKAKQVTNHICIYVCMYMGGMILFQAFYHRFRGYRTKFFSRLLLNTFRPIVWLMVALYSPSELL